MNNTVTQVIMCLAGLAVIAACCVYMVNAGRQEAPKEQPTSMPIEMLQQWEQAKKEAVEKETEALRKRVEELEAKVKEYELADANADNKDPTLPPLTELRAKGDTINSNKFIRDPNTGKLKMNPYYKE